MLLHGFLGAPAAWDPVRALLPDDVPVLTPALSGHGGAPVVSTWDEEVSRLLSEVEAEGFSGAHLAGYSLGGRLALSMAARRPDLFSRLTLLSAGRAPGVRGAGSLPGRLGGPADLRFTG